MVSQTATAFYFVKSVTRTSQLEIDGTLEAGITIGLGNSASNTAKCRAVHIDNVIRLSHRALGFRSGLGAEAAGM